MQNNGNLNSLTERMRARAEQEQQELEALTRQQFAALSRNLHESSKTALSTTEAAIQRQLSSLEQNVTTRCRTLSWMFSRKWLQIQLITMSILMGATLGGWGLLTLAGNKVISLHREITMLSERKESLEAENARLWATFKGLEPHHDRDGKDYLLTLEGWTIIHGGTLNKRDAWKIVRK